MAFRGNKPNNDYLKYWRVIRYFVKAKYGLTQSDLDVLLFLYSEKYFNKDKFEEFDELLSWDEDRFDRLLRDEWISCFRPYKGKRVIGSIYKKLNGEEIPVSQSTNPIFAKNVSYSDRKYREFIKEMNAYVRQQRHHAPE